MLRQKINDHRRPVTIAAVVLFVSATAYLLHGLRDADGSSGQQTVFYTVDDGKTFFTDDDQKLPPFDHDGTPAVRAYLFTTDSGKHRWVQYLQKFPQGTARPTQANAAAREQFNAGLVKHPGDKDWVSATTPAGIAVMTPQRPPGVTGGELEQALP